jgi:hypothetical protein
MNRGRRPLALVLVLGLASGLVACGNENVVTATDVARAYVSAIADGGFSPACGMLAPATRNRLESATRLSCAALLARCLPTDSNALGHDQSQLFYVNAEPRVVGGKTDVHLTGLPVARELGDVTLTESHGQWHLTAPGKKLARCARRLTTAHRTRTAGSARRKNTPRHPGTNVRTSRGRSARDRRIVSVTCPACHRQSQGVAAGEDQPCQSSWPHL